MILIRAEVNFAKGIPPKAIMGLSIGLPLVAILAIVMGAVHYISKRHSRKLEEKRNARVWPHQVLPARPVPHLVVTHPTPNLSSPIGAPLNRCWSQPAPMQTQPAPTQHPQSLYPGRYATVGHGHVRNGGAGLQRVPQAYDPVNRRTAYLG